MAQQPRPSDRASPSAIRLAGSDVALDLSAGALVQADGPPAALSTAEVQLLRALYAAGGQTVTRDELCVAVRPDDPVEPGTISTLVHRLRHKLGDAQRALVTVIGEGYRLEVADDGDAGDAPAPPTLLGRRDALAALSSLPRVAWVTGAGGVGKTTLVRAFVDRLAAAPSHPTVLWIDLTGADGPISASLALTRGLGLTSHGRDTTAALGDRVRAALALLEDTVVVLDAADAVTEPVAAWLQGAEVGRGTRVVAVSRVAPRGVGTFVVPPLDPATARELFRLRLVQARLGAPLGDAEGALADTVADRLDGLPLGLEIAACRAARSSLDAVARPLDDLLATLQIPDGPLPPQHRSLWRVLDESFALEPGPRRALLLLLALVPRELRRGEIRALSPDTPQSALQELVASGWLVPDPSTPARLRLPGAARSYLLAVSARAPERGAVNRALVRYALDVVAPWLSEERYVAPSLDMRPLLRERELLRVAAERATSELDRVRLRAGLAHITQVQGPRPAVERALAELPEIRRPPLLAAEVWNQRFCLHATLGDTPAMMASLARALELADEAHATSGGARGAKLLVRLLAYEAQYSGDDVARAERALDRAGRLAATVDDGDLTSFVATHVATHLRNQERYTEALDVLERAGADEDAPHLAHYFRLGYLAAVLVELGRHDEAAEVCDALDDHMVRLDNHVNSGYVALFRAIGQLERAPAGDAAHALEAARRRLDAVGPTPARALAELLLLVAARLHGDADGAPLAPGVLALVPHLDRRHAAWAEALAGWLEGDDARVAAAERGLGDLSWSATRAAIAILRGEDTVAVESYRVRLSRALVRGGMSR